MFEGDFNKSLYKSGLARILYSNGDFYEGMTDEGKRHGSGIHMYANGDEFDGDWI